MKARTDCSKCRKEIHEEEYKAFLKKEYAFFSDAAYSMAVFATIVALCVHERRGRTKEYIQKFFDEMCFMFDYPEFKGKRVKMTDIQHMLEKDYGIDFGKIKLHIESEKEFIYGTLKGE